MIRKTSLVLLMGTCTFAWADNAPVELNATTIDGERDAASGVQLDEPIRTGSRLGLTARETPASIRSRTASSWAISVAWVSPA